MRQRRYNIMPKNHNIKNKKTIKFLCYVFIAIATLCFALFSISIIFVGILPIKYSILLIVIFGIIIITADIFLLKVHVKKWLKITSFIILVLVFLTSMAGLFYINKTYTFLNSLKPENYITEKYYIITNNYSEYDKIEDLNNKNIETFNEQLSVYDEAIKELNKVVNILIVLSRIVTFPITNFSQ